ncbi:MAG: transposase [Anaerolineales bacterium]
MEQVTSEGLEYLPTLIEVLINTAMQAERSKYLKADLYERTDQRNGFANGYKPKTVKTRIGDITFDVPQVRDGTFYPGALEKGLRSERALTNHDPGRDVCPGCFNPEGQSDHREALRNICLLNTGEQGHRQAG